MREVLGYLISNDYWHLLFISAATCPNDILGGGLQNQAAYKIGPYSYQEELDLNCTVATEFFQKRRNCVYNRGTDQYELQGSSYECGGKHT